MLKKTNVELENLTPELARQFASMEKLPGERPLKARRLKFFEDHINAGTFIDPSWSVGLCKQDGKKYRLDGQHTSTMLASLPPERFPTGKLATIVTYEFDSIADDAAALFDTFDNPASARSNEDMMGVFRSHYDDLDDLSNSLCVQVGNGIYLYESKQKEGKLFPPRVRGFYFDNEAYRNFAHWMRKLQDDATVVNGWLFAKPGIVAEMIADWLTSEQIATDFWSYVLKENHPDRDNITRELAEDFKKWRVKQERKSQDDYHNRAQKGWKRYRKELEIELAA